jgi:hypothetical protein
VTELSATVVPKPNLRQTRRHGKNNTAEDERVEMGVKKLE